MNKKEELALFFGMLCGDGCLTRSHNGEGYRVYPIDFVNTDKNKVIIFNRLLNNLFGIKGKIYPRKRKNRKLIWTMRKHCRNVYEEIKTLGFPEGVKRDVLRIPALIKKGTKNEKIFFVKGLIITDGSIKKDGGILFHLGSKLFLEDLSNLIKDIIKIKKPIKEFMQLNKYKSYQLYLNKMEGKIFIDTSRRGTMVLHES